MIFHALIPSILRRAALASLCLCWLLPAAAQFTQWVEDVFPAYEVELDTRLGPIICTLVQVERDKPELKDCRTQDGRPLSNAEIEALSLGS